MTREEAIEFIAQSVKGNIDMALVTDAIKALENQKTGRWIRLPEDYPLYDLEYKGCSVCHTHYPKHATIQFRYCPNCGANMKGEN